jgi:hypothetical protein
MIVAKCYSAFHQALFIGILLFTFTLKVDSARNYRKTLLRDENTLSLQPIDRDIEFRSTRKSLKQFMIEYLIVPTRQLNSHDDNAFCEICSSPIERNSANAVPNSVTQSSCLSDTVEGLVLTIASVPALYYVFSTFIIPDCGAELVGCFLLGTLFVLFVILYLPSAILVALFSCGGPLLDTIRNRTRVDDFNLLISGLLNDVSLVDKISDLGNSHRKAKTIMNETIQQAIDSAIVLSLGGKDIGTFITNEVMRSLTLIVDAGDEESYGGIGMYIDFNTLRLEN